MQDQLTAHSKIIHDNTGITDGGIIDFFQKNIRTEKGYAYDFGNREFLYELLQDVHSRIVITKGRQVGASTMMAGLILYNAIKYPKTLHLYVADTLDHARGFARHRFRPILRDTGLAQDIKKQDDLILEVRLPLSQSTIIMMSSQDGFRQAQSYSADFIYLDEAHASEIDAIGALLEGMDQSRYNRAIIAGIGAPEGTKWHDMWLKSDMKEWDITKKKWIKTATQESVYRGYHIPQTLMPNSTDQTIADKRKKYSKAIFDMHIMGVFSSAAGVPLTAAEARLCYYDADTVVLPSHVNHEQKTIIASLDLAHGGDAFTVLSILGYDKSVDKLDVLTAEKYDDNRNYDLVNKIIRVIKSYEPDVIISDAGGNIDLLQRLRDNYDVLAFKPQKLEHGHISYQHDNEALYPISKSYMMQRTIDRFLRQDILIPNCAELYKWTLDHVTAEQSELIEPKGSMPYTRYDKLPNRQDDFMQTLMFAESLIYSYTDIENPRNKHAEIVGIVTPKW